MPKAYENPLLPNQRLKQLYEALVTLRHQRPARKPYLEAVRAAPALLIGDTPGDQLLTPTKSSLSPTDQAFFALGTAVSLIPTRNTLILYLDSNTFPILDLPRLLKEALRLTLPVIFIMLPVKGNSGAAALATKLGIPGIPVDASDSIALYRVAQESLVRARAAGGPALIEPILLPSPEDPITLLARQLLARRIVTQRWISSVAAKHARA